MHFCPSCQTCLDDKKVSCPKCGHSEGPRKNIDPLKEVAKQRQLRESGLDHKLEDIEGDGNSPIVYGAAAVVFAMAIWILL